MQYSNKLELTGKDREHLWALYSAQVRFTDEFIGQLLDALKEAGIDRETLIVFTSDHGERLYSHGCFVSHAGPPHEDVVKVPLIVRCESIVQREKKVSEQVASIDLFPTILDFAGCKFPSLLEGMSLYSSIVRSCPLSEKRPIFTQNNLIHWGRPGQKRVGWNVGLRFNGKKFIYYPSSGDKELFDLTSDPEEVKNIVEESSETQQFEQMVQEFIRRRPHGYYLVFADNGSERTFEGELIVEGDFSRIFFQGV